MVPGMLFKNEGFTEFASDCSDWLREDCVVEGDDGNSHVSLSVPRDVWFEFIESIGGGLHVACSPVAVLGVSGSYSPELAYGSEPVPSSECGLYSPNLPEFGSLWALREQYDDGAHYLLEVRDVCGCPAQRVLIPHSANDVFLEFVSTFQTAPDERGTWFSPNNASAEHRRRTLSNRIPWLRQLNHKEVAASRVLPIEFIDELLARSLERSLQVRTTIYNRAILQGAIWTPEMRSLATVPAGGQNANVIRYFGDGTGLELIQDCKASAWLWTGQCNCCGEEKWAIEVGGPNDELSFAVRSVGEKHETQWRSFLQELL
ncbi:MAG: hypothetical protein CMO80_06645 [Verrucomicrobiales bacterium]|nr:hypothetical protein [Verrucomicrobiales bacterium]|tara:strand:- start:13990 stop:14940 length:951 start_codon:yes stop_codon:yes gene_type:complete